MLALGTNVIKRELGQDCSKILALVCRVNKSVSEVDFINHLAVFQVAYLFVSNEDCVSVCGRFVNHVRC